VRSSRADHPNSKESDKIARRLAWIYKARENVGPVLNEVRDLVTGTECHIHLSLY